MAWITGVVGLRPRCGRDRARFSLSLLAFFGLVLTLAWVESVSAQTRDTLFVVVDLEVKPFQDFDLGDPVTKLSASSPVTGLECNPGWCRVRTMSGDGWVLRDQLTASEDSIAAARQFLADAGYDQWDVVDRSVWRTFISEPYRIDQCAVTIAHGGSFDPMRDWPAYCNTFRHTGPVVRRVSEIEAMIDHLAAADRERVLEGKVWIGASAEAVEAAWGRPRDINSTTTAAGRTEQWVYSGNYVYLENGIVTAIQGG